MRRPGFALVAASTLALGIGANTAMFSVADAVVFRSLPHREPERLAMVWREIPALNWTRGPNSYPKYADLREQTRGFEDLAAFTNVAPVTVDAGGTPERVSRSQVSANLLAVLGNGALVGRTLVETDDAPGAELVVVVSEAYWRTRLGGAADALGRTIRVEGEPHVVVGVMPADFAFPQAEVDLWTPLGADAADLERDLSFLQLIGRLAPGVTMESAERDVAAVMDRLAEAYPHANEGVRLWVEPRHTFVVGDVRRILLVLQGAVALVLVIACANLANLMLARGAARSRELAVRSALGAGRGRIVRQLLTESGLIGLLGGVAGAAIAYTSSGVLRTFASFALPRAETISVDGRALLFTAAIALASGVLVGLVPALRAPGGGEVLR
ncbi:MAG: ABC transporter permease, partial [Longimicrobiales bacterium]